MENEKNLLEVFQVFIKRFRTLLLIVFGFLILGSSFGFFLNQEEYLSTTSLTVGAETERNTGDYNSQTGEPIQETYIKYGSNKISNEKYTFYKEIFKSSHLLKEVITNLDLELSVNELRESISIEVPENSSTILLTVSSPDYKNVDTVVNKLVGVFKEQTYELTGLENIKVTNVASEPKKNNSVNINAYVLLSLFFGTIIALIVVLFQEYLDDSVQSEREIKNINLPIIGRIKNLTYEEDLKKTRTNIEYVTQFKNKNMFVITTASIEGKNISENLAGVMAQADKQVLLVDADFRGSKNFENPNLENDKGLSDLLINDFNSESIIKAYKNNQQILTTGSNLENPSEKLSSVKMEQLLSKFQEEFSYVIIKGHPINDVTDSVVLSTLTDGVILQVEVGQTKMKDILRAKETLSNISVDILGIILVYNK